MKLAPDGFVWCGKKGDLTLYLTHIEQQGQPDAALYLRNENRRVETVNPLSGEPQFGCPGFLVPYSGAWRYRPEDRDRGPHYDMGEMTHSLAEASVQLYGFDVPEYRHRIHDAILEFLDDVKNQRPPPTKTFEQWASEMRAAGIVLKQNGKELN